jgi:RNA recognition motif-containing protein
VNGQKIAVDKPLFALEKNNTLVLKNLPFSLKTEKLQEILNKCEVKPTSVNYHVDASGMFRGMAFAKYKNTDESSKAYELLNGLEVFGRKIRVEFKRKNSNASANPSQQKLEKDRQEKALEKQNASNVHLDLENLDEDNKKFYEQLVAFKENTSMTEFTFPSALSSYQKKQINHLADKLGLTHESDAKNVSQRYSLVIKKGPVSPANFASTASSDDSSTNSNSSNSRRKNSRAKNPWLAEKKDSDSESHLEKGSYANINIPQSGPLKSSPKLSPSFPTSSPPLRGHLRNSLSIQPIRQPRGPDGSRGFAAGRGKLIQSVS